MTDPLSDKSDEQTAGSESAMEASQARRLLRKHAVGIAPEEDDVAEDHNQQVPAEAAPSSPLKVDEDSIEREVWWGSYSGWTMAPSFLVCCCATILVLWLAELLLPRGFVQLAVFGIGGAIWLFQLVRWGYRVVSYNYRLTNRRLYCDTGFFHQDRRRVDLNSIADVRVRRTLHEGLVGVGRIEITFQDSSQPALLLEGVRNPSEVASLMKH